MDYRIVAMGMAVRPTQCRIARVRVAVVFVVYMKMIVLQGLMSVRVRVPLGEMKPEPPAHKEGCQDLDLSQ